MSTTIYALCDPTSGEVRYVGKAQNSAKRLAGHLQHSRREGRKAHVACWIRSLGALSPIMRELVVVPDDYGNEMEIRTVAHFRANGYRLTNITAGGEGAVGHRHSEEHKTRMSALMKQREWTPEHREKVRLAITGRKRPPFSQEWRDNISVSHRGKTHSAESIAKMSAAKTGKPGHPQTAETRAKMSAAHKGKKRSPEAIAAIVAGRAGYRHSPETRAKISAAKRGTRPWNFRRSLT